MPRPGAERQRAVKATQRIGCASAQGEIVGLDALPQPLRIDTGTQRQRGQCLGAREHGVPVAECRIDTLPIPLAEQTRRGIENR